MCVCVFVAGGVVSTGGGVKRFVGVNRKGPGERSVQAEGIPSWNLENGGDMVTGRWEAE